MKEDRATSGVRVTSTLVCGLFLVGCGADPPASGETDLLLSIASSRVDFEEKETFFVHPVVLELCEQPEGATTGTSDAPCLEVDHSYDEGLLRSATEGLSDLGYEEVAEPEDGDWVLVVGVVARQRWDFGEVQCFDDEGLSGCVEPLSHQNIQFPSGSVAIYLLDGPQEEASEWVADWMAGVDQRFAAGVAPGFGGGMPTEEALSVWDEGIRLVFEQSPALNPEGAALAQSPSTDEEAP